jgi:hypothetical protein
VKRFGFSRSHTTSGDLSANPPFGTKAALAQFWFAGGPSQIERDVVQAPIEINLMLQATLQVPEDRKQVSAPERYKTLRKLSDLRENNLASSVGGDARWSRSGQNLSFDNALEKPQTGRWRCANCRTSSTVPPPPRPADPRTPSTQDMACRRATPLTGVHWT